MLITPPQSDFSSTHDSFLCSLGSGNQKDVVQNLTIPSLASHFNGRFHGGRHEQVGQGEREIDEHAIVDVLYQIKSNGKSDGKFRKETLKGLGVNVFSPIVAITFGKKIGTTSDRGHIGT